MTDTVEIKMIRGCYEQFSDKLFENLWHMDKFLGKKHYQIYSRRNRKPDLSHKH